MEDSTCKTALKIIVAFLLPPAAAFWQVRLSLHFWINIILWFIGWLPGTAHAIWLILREKYQVLNVDVPRTEKET